MTNLYSTLTDRFASRLDAPFLRVPGGATSTYREVDHRSACMAGALRELGVNAGDRVVAQIDKSTDNVALYLACLRVGAVFLPLNTAYTSSEVGYFVDDASPAVVVARPGTLDDLSTSVVSLGTEGDGSFAEATDAATPFDGVVERGPDDLAAMLYTSGTTGRSKGAMLTHANLESNALALHDIWGFEPDDVLLHTLPIFHVHGLFIALHCAMLSGNEVIFLTKFDVAQVVEQLPNATVMMGVPTQYTRLLAHQPHLAQPQPPQPRNRPQSNTDTPQPQPQDLQRQIPVDHDASRHDAPEFADSRQDLPEFDAAACASIRLFTSGSAPMTEAVHAEFTARTGHQILERYGMTEAGMITSNPYTGDRVPGTVGFPLPDVELRVCDDDGSPIPTGETGVVEIRSPGLFAGYWQMPEKTASEHRDGGWFITGDVGSVDAEGRLTLEGRSSDMIISGGYNVYPKEVELVLDELPGVLETGVIGVPHPDFGEAVVAVVVRDGSIDVADEELAAALDGVLARFKHPKRYIAADALPRNAMSKVQKAALRTGYANLFAE